MDFAFFDSLSTYECETLLKITNNEKGLDYRVLKMLELKLSFAEPTELLVYTKSLVSQTIVLMETYGLSTSCSSRKRCLSGSNNRSKKIRN